MTGGITRKVKKLYGVVPTSAGTSKNLLPVYDLWLGNSYGISCVRNADGSIHVSGTAESDSTVYILAPDYCLHLPEGYYTLSMGGTMPEGINIIFEYYDETGAGWLGSLGTIDSGNLSATGQIGATNSPSIYIRVYEGYSVDVTLYPQLEAGSEATDYVPYGEVIEGRTRKIKKSYDVVGGVTRLFYSADFLTYDGAYTVSQVTYDGKLCNLYTLTGSGILTLNDDALFWMCGGGSNGGSAKAYASSGYVYGGFGGGGGYILSGEIASGSNMVVTVGAGNCGQTSIIDGDTSYITQAHASIPCKDGASGGGGTGSITGNDEDYNYNHGEVGTGTGESTIPFGIADLGQHCAGGAAGVIGTSVYDSNHTIMLGGAGGSNGGNGGKPTNYMNTYDDGLYGRNGGTKGGGKGRGLNYIKHTFLDGSDATFYGSGGGGGATCYDNVMSGPTFTASAYNGYQGVVYILDVNGGVPA